MAQLTHEQYDLLEQAVALGHRIAVARRGTEFIVIPLALASRGGREVLEARNPTTGDQISLSLDELESIERVSQ